MARTLDDPDLPRAWSKYSKGSSNGTDTKKVKLEVKPIVKENDLPKE